MKPFNLSANVRINPFWRTGDKPDDICRYDSSPAREPDGWSVETGELDTWQGLGITLWNVEADFKTRDEAMACAAGGPTLTKSYAQPGGGDELGWLVFTIVDEPEFNRAHADWVEWAGACSEVTLADAIAYVENTLGATPACDLSTLDTETLI